MFRRRREPIRRVTLMLDGRPIVAEAGEPVAAAVLAATGTPTRRSPVEGALRAPYCFMGACFECLMEIDGVPNQQACLVSARDGMIVARPLDATAGDVV
jgi:predicted molibdopterin-dependent oxidoreductase YjgC